MNSNVATINGLAQNHVTKPVVVDPSETCEKSPRKHPMFLQWINSLKENTPPSLYVKLYILFPFVLR